MPEVIALRRNFVSETDHYKMLQADILDEALFSRITVSGDIVVICEGLLMYFEEAEVMGFLSRLIKNTHSGSLIIESLGSFAKLKVNPVIKGIGENSRYVWTINNPEKLQVNNCLSAVESMTIFDINKERWGIYGKLMSSNYLNKRVSSKITQYRYECQS
jgi:O-methyltransferase involved in polyketide biosynthesis